MKNTTPNHKSMKAFFAHCFALILFFGAQNFGAKAQSASKDTLTLGLKDAISYALNNSSTIQNAKLDIANSEQKVKEITSMAYPQISASGTFMQYGVIPGQYIRSDQFGPTPPGAPAFTFLQFQQKYTAQGVLSWNQLIFDGTFFLGLKAAQQFVNLSQLFESKSKYDAQINTVKAYIMIVSTQKNIALMDANIAALKKTLNELRLLNKEGFTEKLDVQKLELSLSNLEAQRYRLTNGIDILYNVLKLTIGMPMQQPIKVTEDIEALNTSIGFDESLLATDTANFGERAEIKLLKQSLVLSKYDEKRYKVGYVPSLFGFAQGQYQSLRSEFNFFKSDLPINNSFVPSTSMGLQLSIPIFDGLKKQYQIKQVLLSRQKTVNDLNAFNNLAQMEFQNAKLNYITNLKLAVEQKKTISLAQEIYNKANIKFKEGVGSSLEILQAETELKTAQTNYLNSLYDLVMSKIDLKKSLGKNIID